MRYDVLDVLLVRCVFVVCFDRRKGNFAAKMFENPRETTLTKAEKYEGLIRGMAKVNGKMFSQLLFRHNMMCTSVYLSSQYVAQLDVYFVTLSFLTMCIS